MYTNILSLIKVFILKYFLNEFFPKIYNHYSKVILLIKILSMAQNNYNFKIVWVTFCALKVKYKL